MGAKPVTGRTRDVVIFLDKLIFRLAKHWLFLANLTWGLYVGLPVLAPILMLAGHTWLGNVIHSAYKVACHQIPWRSFFIGGSQMAYTYDELITLLGPALTGRYVGDATIGYKVAICQRDVATYGAILLAGLVFGLVRRWLIKPLPIWVFVLSLVPMGIDGTTQLFGLRESNWQLRVITGALFGLASVWLAYPYLEEGMREIRDEVNKKLHLE
jgi:uncharacterized membrane protein